MVAYAPWADPKLARKPGVQPLDPANWIERGPDHVAQMAYRERLIAERRDVVFAEEKHSRAAQDELLLALTAHPDSETGAGDDLPLVRAGGMVQEDFCILQQNAAGQEYRLTAAILCFPSRWSLAEKIGHPLTHIHGPVPDYTDDLAKRVNRMFEGVRADKPLWRANWTVHSTDELHQPSGDFRDAEDPDARLYIRVERQTFVRLPRTRAVVFGIRTYIDPLEALTPDQAGALYRALGGLDVDEIEYRGGNGLNGAALARLRQLDGMPGLEPKYP